jgi:hypothetical protein
MTCRVQHRAQRRSIAWCDAGSRSARSRPLMGMYVRPDGDMSVQLVSSRRGLLPPRLSHNHLAVRVRGEQSPSYDGSAGPVKIRADSGM